MAKERNLFEATTRAVREMNAASAQTSSQHLSQLQAAKVEAAEITPEVVVVPIPDVSFQLGPRTATETPLASKTSADQAPTIKAELSSDNDSQQKPTQRRARFSNPPPAEVLPEQRASSTLASQPTSKTASTESATPAMLSGDAWWHSLPDLGQDRIIDELSRKILRQFPSIAPCSLLITSADVELSTNRSTARIAACVARLTGCRVLLVDANWEANMSAIQQGERSVRGLSEVIVEGLNWKDLLVETQESKLCVLPCGIAEVPIRRIGNETLLGLNSQWQRDFTYVFINGGNARQWVARRFAVCCDGTYLLVGLNQTTRSDAQSAIRVLAESHARVMGAIVFDTPPQG